MNLVERGIMIIIYTIWMDTAGERVMDGIDIRGIIIVGTMRIIRGKEMKGMIKTSKKTIDFQKRKAMVSLATHYLAKDKVA